MESKYPLVSIGIPTYNRPEGLQKILTCIANQTYQNLEIIVSDNCTSGGRVDELMEEGIAKDLRLRYFKQEKNIGAIPNFEFVLAEATGKYFFWAADDDLCEKDFIEKIVFSMEQDSDVALCSCDVKIIDENDHLLGVECLTSIRPEANWKNVKKLFYRYPTSNIFFSIYGIYKTEVVRRCNIRISCGWKGMATNGEVPFLAQLAAFGKITAIEDVLKIYRRHSDSMYHREVSGVSKRDAFMMRLVIRVKLVKLVLAGNDSLLEKLSLLFEIVKSGLASIDIKGTVIALIPKKIRKVLKNYAEKLSYLRR